MAFVDHDRENIGANVMKSKINKDANKISSRHVLGTLNNNNIKIDEKLVKKIKPQIVQKKIAKNSFNVLEDDNVQLPSITELKTNVDKVSGNIELISEQSEVDYSKCLDLKDIFPAAGSVKESLTLPVFAEKTEKPKSTLVKASPGRMYCLDVYSDDILKYLKELEKDKCAKPNYMRRQRDINYNMRTILVDWLVEVAEEYKMHTQTLFLAVSFVDRFLSVMSVVKAKLQLLGTASMMVAAKCEEILPPEVGEFVYITDETYTLEQVIRMEYLILKVLEFEISRPTAYSFLTHLCSAFDLPEKVMFLSQYLCELTLLEGDPFLQYKPSVLACSAIAVAQHCLGYSDVWTNEFNKTTGYSLNDLESCITHLNATHAKSCTLEYKAVFNKYANKKLLHVSSIKAIPLDVAEYMIPMKEMGDVTIASSPDS